MDGLDGDFLFFSLAEAAHCPMFGMSIGRFLGGENDVTRERVVKCKLYSWSIWANSGPPWLGWHWGQTCQTCQTCMSKKKRSDKGKKYSVVSKRTDLGVFFRPWFALVFLLYLR